MNVLCAMAYKIQLLQQDFNGDEFDVKLWESEKINGSWYYRCTRIGKKLMHLVIYLKCLLSPDFQESSRKKFLENFAAKFAKLKGVIKSKKVFECRGAGADHLKKSCRTTGISKGGFNACSHIAHKHGIVYVIIYTCIYIYVYHSILCTL